MVYTLPREGSDSMAKNPGNQMVNKLFDYFQS